MPHSHHSHSGQFCKHASGSLENVVQVAIRNGFQVYGLTEHVPRYRVVDLYPEEKTLSLDVLSEQFHQFLEEAHRLKMVYEPQISVLVGLETEHITKLDLDRLEDLLQMLGSRVEYIVGSVHHANEIPIDFDLATYQSALASFTDVPEAEREEALFSAYFDAQYELCRRFKPELIGHFDLCRLFNPSIAFSNYPNIYAKIERNFTLAVSYGALFEVNAAAFRKGWSTAYPGEDVVQVIHKHGGRFALSDDSHGPHAVGLNYDRLPRYLQSMGINELWYLKKSEIPNVGGRYVQPVKLQGNPLDHSYWRQKAIVELL